MADAHFGCTRDSDLELVYTPGITQLIKAKGTCALSKSCDKVLKQEIFAAYKKNFTPPCHKCFVESVDCGLKHCVGSCMPWHSLEGCVECALDRCKMVQCSKIKDEHMPNPIKAVPYPTELIADETLFLDNKRPSQPEGAQYSCTSPFDRVLLLHSSFPQMMAMCMQFSFETDEAAASCVRSIQGRLSENFSSYCSNCLGEYIRCAHDKCGHQCLLAPFDDNCVKCQLASPCISKLNGYLAPPRKSEAAKSESEKPKDAGKEENEGEKEESEHDALNEIAELLKAEHLLFKAYDSTGKKCHVAEFVGEKDAQAAYHNYHIQAMGKADVRYVIDNGAIVFPSCVLFIFTMIVIFVYRVVKYAAPGKKLIET